jgi:hypothetical protein
MGSVTASETEEKQVSTWGQGDAAIRGGPVNYRFITKKWQNQTRLSPLNRARSDKAEGSLTGTSQEAASETGAGGDGPCCRRRAMTGDGEDRGAVEAGARGAAARRGDLGIRGEGLTDSGGSVNLE